MRQGYPIRAMAIVAGLTEGRLHQICEPLSKDDSYFSHGCQQAVVSDRRS